MCKIRKQTCKGVNATHVLCVFPVQLFLSFIILMGLHDVFTTGAVALNPV